jgi:phosphatidylserine synthase
MSKLTPKDKFLDLSDYGRPFGKFLANALKNTDFTAIHVTLLFGISGLIAIYCILINQFYWAAFFIILKSGIDAADGELARLKKQPSYVGRYLDSVFDICLNFIFFFVFCYKTDGNYAIAFASFCCLQLQGTLYNFYYVILRNKVVGGDTTSKIFENKAPIALPGEKQKNVNLLFNIYTIVYGLFDKIIQFFDTKAHKVYGFPNWFMTFLSIYGLGFQLLIMSVFLCLGWIAYIIPFFIAYTTFILILISIRKTLFKTM